MTKLLAVTLALLVPAFAARAEPQASRAGDVYEITTDREASGETAGGESTGSSHDRDAIIERVVAVRGDGLELEFDLPKEATADDRARTWQFPVRVLKPAQGPMQLLNRPELEARIDTWLKAASLTRAACGQWYFTWSAFQIQCDPQSVIGGIEPFWTWTPSKPSQRACALSAAWRQGGGPFQKDLRLDVHRRGAARS